MAGLDPEWNKRINVSKFPHKSGACTNGDDLHKLQNYSNLSVYMLGCCEVAETRIHGALSATVNQRIRNKRRKMVPTEMLHKFDGAHLLARTHTHIPYMRSHFDSIKIACVHLVNWINLRNISSANYLFHSLDSFGAWWSICHVYVC